MYTSSHTMNSRDGSEWTRWRCFIADDEHGGIRCLICYCQACLVRYHVAGGFRQTSCEDHTIEFDEDR